MREAIDYVLEALARVVEALTGLEEANRLLLARVERLEAGRIRDADPVDAEHQRWLAEKDARQEEQCRMVEEGR